MSSNLQSFICPTCGCSLVRLGINPQKAVEYVHKNVTYYFCCNGCLTIFKQSPEKYVKEIQDLFICPTCLAEKPVIVGVKFVFKDNTYYFCRCPECIKEFEKKPEYYLKRLTGEITYQGIFGEDACCPE